MSVRVMSTVWDNATVSGGKLLTLLALADWADDDGTCWPSVARVAEKCRTSERTVRRHLRELEDEGWLTSSMRHGRSTMYRVHDPGQNVRPDRMAPRTEPTEPRTPVSGGADTGVPQNHQDTSGEPSPADGAADGEPARPSHQQVVDSLVAACGLTLPLTRAEGGRVAAAAKQLRAVLTLDDRGGIAARAAAYRRRWPDAALTPTALAANWSQVVADTATAARDPVDDAVALAENLAAVGWDLVAGRLEADGYDRDAITAAHDAWHQAQEGAAA